MFGGVRDEAITTTFDLLKTAMEMPDYDLVNVYAQAHDFARAIGELKSDRDAKKTIGGIVVFGSGRGSKQYEDLVYDSTHVVAERGIAVRHGGAGGFMETAGKAALDAKSLSIGVPMTGRNSLATEKRISTEAQSFTIATGGYETRIPVLLEEVPLAVFAPGGMGTMRELAVVLVHEASQNDHRWISFIGRQYYGGLTDFMASLPLPKEILERVSVVKSSQEMLAVVKEIQKDDPKSFDKLTRK
jgi:predicted Rossmann-fold nucleotide-binding protein